MGYFYFPNGLVVGELNNLQYRNGTIVGLLSNYNISKSILDINGNISDKSNINIKIGGVIYQFKFSNFIAADNVSQFICEKIIFSSGKEYDIEFLN